MEVLNEVYFGRDAVAPILKQLTKFRSKLAGKPVSSTTNIDPELIKFNRLCENIFGFNTFSIYIQPDHTPNAYAFPVDMYFSDEERKAILNSLVLSPDKHFKYKSAMENVSLVIAIHMGILDNEEFTNEMILGILLHEIGHGFFEAVMDNNCTYTSARKLTNLLLNINKMAIEKVKAGKEVTEKVVNREVSNFNAMITDLKNKFAFIKGKFVSESVEEEVLDESLADNMKRSRLSYTNEKFADTFAAMFGYGAEAHDGCIKIMNYVTKELWGVKKYPKVIESFKAYKLYINDLLAYIMNMQDEHPSDLARVKITIDYLKRELAKEALDPKLKKELLAELQKNELLIEEYIKYPRDEDSMRILRLYYIKLYEKFGGDRREQDTDNDALFKQIDDRYNELNKG